MMTRTEMVDAVGIYLSTGDHPAIDWMGDLDHILNEVPRERVAVYVVRDADGYRFATACPGCSADIYRRLGDASTLLSRREYLPCQAGKIISDLDYVYGLPVAQR